MMENFTLSNGVSIPAVGYGTYLADCDSAAVVENALRAATAILTPLLFMATRPSWGAPSNNAARRAACFF